MSILKGFHEIMFIDLGWLKLKLIYTFKELTSTKCLHD